MTYTDFSFDPLPLLPDLTPVFNDKDHSYTWQGFPLPGVSHLLDKTGIKEPFNRFFWQRSLMRKGMTEEEAETHMDKVRDDSCLRGSEAHYSIERRCRNEPLELDRELPAAISKEDLQLFVMRSEQAMKELQVQKFLGVEMQLVHPVGHYCGTVDAVVETPDGITVLDWKTTGEIKKAKKERWQLFQMAAYLGAINHAFKEDGICALRVANAYCAPDGYKLAVYEKEDVLGAWRELQGLLLQYWELRVDRGQDYHHPELAAKALAAIQENWGPFE
jgi:RecB family exonuclease